MAWPSSLRELTRAGCIRPGPFRVSVGRREADCTNQDSYRAVHSEVDEDFARKVGREQKERKRVQRELAERAQRDRAFYENIWIIHSLELYPALQVQS